MKRDWDQVRDILLTVEETDRFLREGESADDWPENHVEHIAMLADECLITGVNVCRNNDGSVNVYINPKARLTWMGHDFLDTIRSEEVWSATKRNIAKAGVGVTVGIIIEVASAYIKEKLKGGHE